MNIHGNVHVFHIMMRVVKRRGKEEEQQEEEYALGTDGDFSFPSNSFHGNLSNDQGKLDRMK